MIWNVLVYLRISTNIKPKIAAWLRMSESIIQDETYFSLGVRSEDDKYFISDFTTSVGLVNPNV